MRKEIILSGIGLFIFVMLLVNVLALTASIDKPRMVLYKNITEGQILEFEESVGVTNDNDFDVEIKVQPTGDWEEKITIYEPEFTLAKGESREVLYKVQIESEGLHSGDILITFFDKESTNDLSVVQELNVFVTKEESSKTLIFILGGVLVILLIILWIFFKNYRGKNEK